MFDHLPWDIIDLNAYETGLDRNLIASIIMVESGGVEYAMRFEPRYRWVLPSSQVLAIAEHLGASVETIECAQKFSFGPMQIMCAIAWDEHGFRGWPVELASNELGIHFGCLHLKKFHRLYASDEARVISAYNRGTPARTPGGLFVNQRYVDKVHKYLYELRKIN